VKPAVKTPKPAVKPVVKTPKPSVKPVANTPKPSVKPVVKTPKPSVKRGGNNEIYSIIDDYNIKMSNWRTHYIKKDTFEIIIDLVNDDHFKELYKKSVNIDKDKWYYNDNGQIIITNRSDSIKVKFFNFLLIKTPLTNLDDYYKGMENIVNNYYNYNNI
jgi:hypothetical protein